MKTIALVNTKGGCGKSTTVVNVAHGLARKGKKVLIIDLESRAGGDVSRTLIPGGSEQQINNTIVEVLTGNKDIKDCVVRSRENLHIVPSSQSLLVVERKFLHDNYENRYVLKKELEKVKNHYDYVLIDCPGAFTTLVENVLMASDMVIVPVRASNFDLDGLEDTVDKLGLFFRSFETVADVKVLPTMFHMQRNVSKSALSYLQKGFGEHVLPAVRESVRAAEFGAFQRTLYEHCPGHGITQDYEQLVDHILAGEKDV
jgi:chromosome partitioning protein